MRNSNINAVIAFIGLIFLSLGSSGQSEAKNQFKYETNTNASYETISGSTGSERLQLNSKIVRNFVKDYPQVSGVTWRKDGRNYVAKFKTGEVSNKVVYARNGQVKYSLKTYTENGLPQRVRSAVKSVYYDFFISSVQELKLNGRTFYFIQMSDAQNWKTVRWTEGELQEIESFQKG
ncbi:MAG TPA: hypothetical protein VM012_14730 [Flavitalea sp.]|nr:hypothetical protein [Flavitalea sp.]